MRQVPKEIQEYLIHFHGNRDLFECHEILEDFWKAHPHREDASTLVGLIQIAVGIYHQRRGNRAGALKMLQSSLQRLDNRHLAAIGLDGPALLGCVKHRVTLLEKEYGKVPFTDLNLPFADSELEAHCKEESTARGWGWKLPSAVHDEELIHRHSRRDRSEVIRERLAKLEQRRSASDHNRTSKKGANSNG